MVCTFFILRYIATLKSCSARTMAIRFIIFSWSSVNFEALTIFIIAFMVINKMAQYLLVLSRFNATK